jgi:membrane-associated protein
MELILLGFIYKFPNYTPLFIFIALILAGFNVPISEDIIIITGGVLSATKLNEKTFEIWLAIFIGAYLSDSIAYWTGRLLGPKIKTIKLLSRLITEERLKKMHAFYDKWGFFALLIGRFIPFGGRNCLFISVGMGNMPFYRFAIIDAFAAFFSTTCVFLIVYNLSEYFSTFLNLKPI